MGAATVYVKNMISDHCVAMVKQILFDEGLKVASVESGKVRVSVNGNVDWKTVNEKLQNHGFEMLDDGEQILVEKIKIAVIDLIKKMENGTLPYKNSIYISHQLGKSYSYLSKVFSRNEGITIERYVILKKIERVKDLLELSTRTLSEISEQLGYSSVHHLSNQFRAVTGNTVTVYRKGKHERIPFDKICV